MSAQRAMPDAAPGDVVKLTEAALQRHVEAAALQLGFATYHTFLSVRSQPGFPDLVCVKDGRLIVAELKSGTGKVTTAQQQWLDAFAAVPCCEVHVWRPDDWYSGRIVRILAGEAVADANPF